MAGINSDQVAYVEVDALSSASSSLSSPSALSSSSSSSSLSSSSHYDNINCNAERGFIYTGHDSSWSSNDVIGIGMLIVLVVIILLWLSIILSSLLSSLSSSLTSSSSSIKKKKNNNRYTIYITIITTLIWVSFIIYRPILLLYIPSSLISFITNTSEFMDRKIMFPNYNKFENPDIYNVLREEVNNLLNLTNNGNGLSLFADTYGGENKGLGRFKKDNDITRAWRVFNIKLGSSYSKNGLKHFPRLTSILEQTPEISACMISIVEPGIQVPLHYGYYKGIMRYMLPTHVPKDRDRVFLCVNGIKYHWTEGEGVLWDDTYAHKVYNQANEPRVVIFLDVIRPITSDKSSGWDIFNNIIVRFATGLPLVQDEIRKTEKQIKI